MNTRTFITIVAIALLAGCAAADDDDFDAEAAPEAGAAAASDEEDDTPATTYTAPDTSGLNYAETFETDPFEAGRWSKSAHGDYARQSVTLAAPYDPSPAFAADRGMTFDIPATKYGVVSKIAPAVSATGDEDLVIQYELRLQDGLDCGGAYLKLLTQDVAVDGFNGDSDYSIMFGPDKCAGTNKVHFIYKHKNPNTGKWEEKHATNPPSIKSDTALHLYTLVVRKDLSYEILIDGKSEKSGKLDGATDFEPPLLPKAEIDDPDETKPKDWVEEEKIKDPEASKPDDWDEDAPAEVPDMDAEKPAGWLDDETADIADPSAEMPEDWDEDEDGEWEAPTIANAKCASAPGCGEWARPLKTNPEYKGKWSAPMIANPAYKGVWAPQKITNPGFFEADHATAKAPLSPIGAVAVEVWTMSKGFHFDNIVVANDVAAAKAFADATFGVKSVQEKKREVTKAARDSKRRRLEAYEQGGVAGYATYYIGETSDLIQNNLIATIVTVLLMFGALIKFCCMGGSDDDDEGIYDAPLPEEDDEDDEDAGGESKGDAPTKKIEEVVEEEEKKPAKKDSKKKKKKKKAGKAD